MTDENTTVLTRIANTSDMQDCNAKLMEEIYNDSTMSLEKKMQSLSRGVANQVKLSQDTQRRVALLAKLGLKANGQLKGLSFLGDDETK